MSFNLDDEALAPIAGLTAAESMNPASEDERDALEDYRQHFLARFAYNSNAIEGSTLTLGDTELVLEGEFPVDTKDKRLQDVFAAIGVKEGSELAATRLADGAEVDETLIKDIHQATALDCQPRARGSYRVTPVYISGSQTVPPNPDQVRGLMADLVFSYGESHMPPVAKAAAFHAMFENIHPFRDGNGRTGRILLNYMLEGAGYPPIAIKASDRSGYLTALEDWQVREDPAPLLGLIRACIEEETASQLETLELTRNALGRG